MAEIALPALTKHKTLRGIVIDAHEISGTRLVSVTSYGGTGRAAKRRWFATRSIALAHAADRADEHGFALIDLTEPAEGE